MARIVLTVSGRPSRRRRVVTRAGSRRTLRAGVSLLRCPKVPLAWVFGESEGSQCQSFECER